MQKDESVTRAGAVKIFLYNQRNEEHFFYIRKLKNLVNLV